jgi:hypothetical protein
LKPHAATGAPPPLARTATRSAAKRTRIIVELIGARRVCQKMVEVLRQCFKRVDQDAIPTVHLSERDLSRELRRAERVLDDQVRTNNFPFVYLFMFVLFLFVFLYKRNRLIML